MDTQNETKSSRPHSISMQSRKKLQLTGVVNVESFNENAVVLSTSDGVLTVTGKQLSVATLNVSDGTLTIDGMIDCLKYKSESEKIWKIFK